MFLSPAKESAKLPSMFGERPVLRNLLFIVAIAFGLAVLVLIMGQSNCQSSLRTCTPQSQSCYYDTVCVDYGEGNMRCSPPACRKVNAVVGALETYVKTVSGFLGDIWAKSQEGGR